MNATINHVKDDSSSDLSFYHDDSSSNISYDDQEEEVQDKFVSNGNAGDFNSGGGCGDSGLCGVIQDNGVQVGDEGSNKDLTNEFSKSVLVVTSNSFHSLPNEHGGEKAKERNEQAQDEIMRKERNDGGVILKQRQQQQQRRRQEQNMKLTLLQQKRNQLLSKISLAKNKRHQIQSETKTTQKEIQSKMYQYNETLYRRKHSLSHYSSKQRKLQSLFKEKDKLDSIHVLQDVFYIFHRGHFTTMNGLRLGISVPSQQTVAPSPTSAVGLGAATNGNNNNSMNNISGHYNNGGAASTNTNANAPNTVSSSSTSQTLSFAPASNKDSVMTHNNHNQSQQQQHQSHSTQNEVPWHEINAGIGMVALLISTMQSKLNLRSRFTILPRGSTTKICFNTSANGNGSGGSSSLDDFFASNYGDGGSGSGSSDSNNNGVGVGPGVGFSNIMNPNSNQEWDLYYHPATFSFFAKRHWNTALNILGYCLYEVVEEVKRRLESFQPQNNANDDRNSGNSNLLNGDEDDRDRGRATYSSMSGGSSKDENQYSPSETKIMIPYDVTLSGDWKSSERSTGYVKVGGLDIGFNGDGIAWTKALRYVATDLKWVIAFIAKYVDL